MCSNNFAVTFRSPVVNNAGPPAPTQGGGLITINGNYFGFDTITATPVVTINGALCNGVTFTTTQIM